MQRKKHEAALKGRVALEMVKGQRTVNEIAAGYGVHPNLITKWKRQLLDGVPGIFSSRAALDVPHCVRIVVAQVVFGTELLLGVRSSEPGCFSVCLLLRGRRQRTPDPALPVSLEWGCHRYSTP